mgnify:CR=1 FL=1
MLIKVKEKGSKIEFKDFLTKTLIFLISLK